MNLFNIFQSRLKNWGETNESLYIHPVYKEPLDFSSGQFNSLLHFWDRRCRTEHERPPIWYAIEPYIERLGSCEWQYQVVEDDFEELDTTGNSAT
jgi:hypothetical protein